MGNVFFINGQGGSGKTSQVRYFEKQPIKDVDFFDFDEGLYSVPADTTKLKQWKENQQRWWFTFINTYKTSHPDRHVVLCGVVAFPWKIIDYGIGYPIHHAFLTTRDSIRKQRLIDRGDEHLWTPKTIQILEIEGKMRDYGAYEVDTSETSIQETSLRISKWITSLL